MGPKKDAKNAVEEPPKEVQPELQPFELVGYGRFEYLNGVVYEGNWKIVKGIKVKQGYGRLLLPFDPQSASQEYYEGNWEDDKIEGYGSYYYPDGAVYSGQWVGGKQHGRGKFTFANGTHYDGIWRDHQMHGSGSYVDHLGRKWEGEFRDGVFESRRQMELSKEKMLQERKQEIKQQIKGTVSKMVAILEHEENYEDKIAHFFALSGLVKSFISGNLASLDSKPKQEWLQLLKLAQNGEFVLLQHRVDCKTIPSERILIRQQQGEGQIAEIFFNKGGKKSSLLFLQVQKGRWIVAASKEEVN